MHERTHASKSHACGHCDKRFSQKASCERHERLHTGDKQYNCKHCNKYNLPPPFPSRMHSPLDAHACGMLVAN